MLLAVSCIGLSGFAYDPLSGTVTGTIATHILVSWLVKRHWSAVTLMAVYRLVIAIVSYPLIILIGAIIAIGCLAGFDSGSASEDRRHVHIAVEYLAALLFQNIGFIKCLGNASKVLWVVSAALYVIFIVTNWHTDLVSTNGTTWCDIGFVFGIWVPLHFATMLVIDGYVYWRWTTCAPKGQGTPAP